jgi:hypothetical protein
MHLGFLVPLLLLIGLTALIHFAPRSDESIRELLVEQSVAAFQATGESCPCPYSLNPLGRRCLVRNQHIRPGGATVFCYPDDVSDAMVQNWRDTHR